MVRLDDLHVVSVPERARRGLGKLERNVHSDRHVRRKHDRYLFCGRFDERKLAGRKTRCPDHHAHALPETLLHMGERAFGTREIDQAIGSGNPFSQVRDNPYPAGMADQLAGIFANQRTCGSFQRRGKPEILRSEHHLDQGSAHAASSSGDDELHCWVFPGAEAASPSMRFSLPSSKNTAMRRYSTSRLSARWRLKT